MTEPADWARGRVAVVTGGSSGIGFESARLLLEAGAALAILVGRDPGRGHAAAARLIASAGPDRAVFAAADLGTTQGAAAVAAAVGRAAPDGIDILVNSAGGDGVPELFHRMPIEAVEAAIRGWLLTTVYACHALLPLVRSGGAIVNVASDAGKAATPGESVIGAAMGGIVMFTRTLAIEAKRSRIRVNAVTPSFVRWTPTSKRVTAGGMGAKLMAKAEAAAQLGIPEPVDVARTILFLASPAAAYVTGQAISVNGGISAA